MEGGAGGRATYNCRDVLTIYKGKDHDMDHEVEWVYAGIQAGKIALEARGSISSCSRGQCTGQTLVALVWQHEINPLGTLRKGGRIFVYLHDWLVYSVKQMQQCPK
jgi:hypothetical protein